MKMLTKTLLPVMILAFVAVQGFAQTASTKASKESQTPAKSVQGKFVDNNNDGVCDNYQSKVKNGKCTNFVDKNGDGICDNCKCQGKGKGNANCCGTGGQHKQGNGNCGGCGNGQGKQHRHGGCSQSSQPTGDKPAEKK
jgi:hypothetical protein